MANTIDSKTKRARLEVRREPYWVQLRQGCHLGYRQVAQGEGAWIAKWRDKATGKRHYRALGVIVESGGSRPAYEQAQCLAKQWFDSLDAGIAPAPVTVRDACIAHVKAIERGDGEHAPDSVKAHETAKRFARQVYAHGLAAIELSRLRANDLQTWRAFVREMPAKVSRRKKGEAVTRPRAAATVNRDMVPLRAALNRAFKAGHVATDAAWRSALTPAKNVGGRREIYLDRNDRRALIEAAAPAIRPFLQALALLPLRPGALAALEVRHFHERLRSLTVGRDKAGKDRQITLPESTARLLAEQCRAKLPAAPIFAQPSGQAWNKDAWKWPIKDAVLAAGLPAGVSAYTLRHSTITDLVTGGLDLLTVAQISGTSVAMIERFYGHLQRARAAQALAELAL